MTDFAAMYDDHQADLFDRLKRECGFHRCDLERYARVGERTSYRVCDGSSPLTVAMVRDLVARHPEPDVRLGLLDFITQGCPVQWVAMPEDGGAVAEDLAETFERGAALVRLRAEHLADGVTDPRERDQQLDQARAIARAAHQLVVDVARQPVGRPRRKARPLALAAEGGAA